jgi:hypothetical protein
MDSNAEYTPDDVVTELIPADLTPDAIILGEQPEADIVWSANVIVDNGPMDEPDFVTFVGSCTASDIGIGYGDFMLEESAIDWLADMIGVYPENLTVVSFRWSQLTY